MQHSASSAQRKGGLTRGDTSDKGASELRHLLAGLFQGKTKEHGLQIPNQFCKPTPDKACFPKYRGLRKVGNSLGFLGRIETEFAEFWFHLLSPRVCETKNEDRTLRRAKASSCPRLLKPMSESPGRVAWARSAILESCPNMQTKQSIRSKQTNQTQNNHSACQPVANKDGGWASSLCFNLSRNCRPSRDLE